ncbi:hypothetical protein [Novosphingobium jiangmenense]|uniref:DUF883 domain-containing protein n=1 Tax=Novosphingobium jiangmenense TaxID=2791981 RepID=A0ABS0HD70_9SPHN|nr:hypothetical protein [Novosphingobium jiangmenense]MBF9150203.1 hypothetical protein [Novosphingobium jiangmenense]
MSEELQANGAESLRDKVDAAKSRLAERTASSKSVQTVKGLIEEHPVASVAAGILLGALVAKALPSLGRGGSKAKDAADDAANSLRKSATGLAAVAGKLAVDYAMRAREAGRDGLHKVEEVGGVVGEKIFEGTDDARRKASDLSEIIRSAAIEASEAALRKVNELASRVKP